MDTMIKNLSAIKLGTNAPIDVLQEPAVDGATANKRSLIISPSTPSRPRKFSVCGDSSPILRPVSNRSSSCLPGNTEFKGARPRTASVAVTTSEKQSISTPKRGRNEGKSTQRKPRIAAKFKNSPMRGQRLITTMMGDSVRKDSDAAVEESNNKSSVVPRK